MDFNDNNELDEAERLFRLAILADENFGKAYYNMGDIFSKRN